MATNTWIKSMNRRMTRRLTAVIRYRMAPLAIAVGVSGVVLSITAVLWGSSVGAVGSAAAWVGAILTAAAVSVALFTNRTDRIFTVNRQAGRAVADLWAAVVAVRRPLSAFDSVARHQGGLDKGVPSAELDLLSKDLEQSLIAVEAAAFYARLVLDEGPVLTDVEAVADLLKELRAYFEEGGDEHTRVDTSRPPGPSDIEFGVDDWLDNLDDLLRLVMIAEETFVEGIRHYFPVSPGQVAATRNGDHGELGKSAYLRGKAESHSRTYRRFAPPQSWRTRWR
ncbi:hypothetical protein AB0O58_22095 [Rhodococcus sp. NPDC080181]|jgi:hypothetical protein|uniref:hypothetical protein n=1 Tax=Rhodococcus sp. NPDC080181 TaxID=3155292 RepID=UPI003450C710